MTDRQRNVFILVLVAGLIAASAVVIGTKKTQLGLDLKGGVQLTYLGEMRYDAYSGGSRNYFLAAGCERAGGLIIHAVADIALQFGIVPGLYGF